MGYGIIRVAKRTTRPSVRGMLRHALREDRVPNAIKGAPQPQVLAGDPTSGAALARLSAALKAAPLVRANTVQAIDVLVTASHADMVALPKERQDAYFEQALDFVAERFGGRENILTAVVHRDEMTPHMQLLIMPRDLATGRFQAGKMLGGPVGLRALHDTFHARVGAHYGLMRGERGQRAEHVPIRQFYAQLEGADKPLPDYVPVPPKPSPWQRIRGHGHAIEDERAKALEHNKRARAELVRRAKLAGQLAPAAVARQADRYRAAVILDELSKKAQEETQQLRDQASQDLAAARFERVQAKDGARIAAGIDEKTQAQLLDRFSAVMPPEYVGQLAKALGVPLQPGKGLCDQIRRAGRAGTLIEAAQLLDQAASGQLRSDAARWTERQAPPPRRVLPREH